MTVRQIGIRRNRQQKHRALKGLLPKGRHSQENQCTTEDA